MKEVYTVYYRGKDVTDQIISASFMEDTLITSRKVVSPFPLYEIELVWKDGKVEHVPSWEAQIVITMIEEGENYDTTIRLR